MLSDFVMVKHKLPWDFPYIHVYPIADAHIGSAEFDQQLFKTWIKTVQDDPFGYAVLAGDMMNNGVKNSKQMFMKRLCALHSKKSTYIKN